LPCIAPPDRVVRVLRPAIVALLKENPGLAKSETTDPPSAPPRLVAGRLSSADLQAVGDWLRLNEDALVAHWDGRISGVELGRCGSFPIERAALGACDLSVLHVGGEWPWLVRRHGPRRGGRRCPC
jgi:hypothetical protein